METQEACRILPMELRITGYTRAGLMPVHDLELERDAINVLESHLHKHPRRGYLRPPLLSISLGHPSVPIVVRTRGASLGGARSSLEWGEGRWQMVRFELFDLPSFVFLAF